MDAERIKVTVVTKRACPLCLMVRTKLAAKADRVDVRCLANDDEEGRRLIDRSGLRLAPLVECDGKFYAGREACEFVDRL